MQLQFEVGFVVTMNKLCRRKICCCNDPIVPNNIYCYNQNDIKAFEKKIIRSTNFFTPSHKLAQPWKQQCWNDQLLY
jgi:hypothetical protein